MINLGTLRADLRKRESLPAKPAQRTLEEAFTQFVVMLALVVIPLTFDGAAKDTFRQPKELVFRLMAFIAGLGFVFYLIRWNEARKWVSGLSRETILLPAAIVGWTVITTLTSGSRALSIETLVTVICCVLLFFASLIAADHHPSTSLLDVAMIAPVLNAVIAICQEYGIWQPFRFAEDFAGHVTTTAFLGNPNDVGTFLLPPAIAAIVAVTVFRGFRQAVYAVIGAILVAGIVASGTRGALLGCGAGAVAVALVLRRNTRIALTFIAIFGIALAFVFTEFGRDTRYMLKALRTRRYDIVLSQRMPAFLTAIDMTRDHPIVGVGPGVYKLRYMSYRMQLIKRYPDPWTQGWPLNFAEAHNDHLQVMAETGIPGYILFLAVFAALAVNRRRNASLPADWSRQFARVFAPGLIAAAFVEMIPQFPLQLAAPRAYLIFFVALCVAWDHA